MIEVFVCVWYAPTQRNARAHLLRAEAPDALLLLPAHQGAVASLVEVPVRRHRHVLLVQLVEDYPGRLDGPLEHGGVDHVELELLREEELHAGGWTKR